MNYLLGIDVGGTFTDFIEVDRDGNVRILKTPSTPARPADGVLEGLRRLAENSETIEAYLSAVELIVHGTTITTNAVITGNYAKTGYVTTKGFRDILNSRRGLKRNAFTAKESPPKPIVPQHLVRTVDERLDRDGNVLVPLDEDDVRAAAAYFRDEGVEAVAVNYLFSFLDGAHEERTREILEMELPGVYITISSRVLPQVRMYERGSTTVFNACVGPLLRGYITDLQDELAAAGFAGRLLTMQSNGGVMSPEVVKDFGANTLLSGPASGPVAALFFARPHGLEDLITLDMGGTSLDACLIRDGRASITNASEIGEYSLALPSLDINAMGAGGGSIAAVDDGGMLTVGPDSAGALPGPVAYGMGGTRPTVTDANLVLGYLNADYFLGGERRLEIEPARAAIDAHVARPMGLDGVRAAAGIVELVNSQMANGVRQVSIARGFDAREATLVVAGGAGPLHACGIASELDLNLVLIPKSCSVLCATGMLTTNLRHDLVRFAPLRLDAAAADAEAVKALNALRAELISSGGKLLDEESVAAERRRFEFTCDMQFEGQFNVLETPIAALDRGPLGDADIADIKRVFAEHHTRVYGYAIPDTPIEIQSVRLAAIGVSDDPPFRPIAAGGASPEAARKDTRAAWFGGAEVATPTYEGGKLEAGNEIAGPAIVEEPTTTVKVDPGWRLRVDEIGSYLLWRDGQALDEVLARLSRRPR